MKHLFTYFPVLLFLLYFQLATAQAQHTTYTLFVFEGSDWCKYCIALEKNVLSDERLQIYLEEKDIELSRIDFPQRKRQSASEVKHAKEIAEKYAFDGSFPSLILVNTRTQKVDKLQQTISEVDELIVALQQKL